MNDHVRTEAVSTVTSTGQTTIPKPVRDALGIKDGTPLKWTLQEDGALKVTAKTKRLQDFAGILGKPPNGKRLTIEQLDEGIARAVAERFRRKTAR